MSDNYLENQLFDHAGWDEHDVMCFTFYNPTLKVQIGDFPANTQFREAIFEGRTSTLTLVDCSGKEHHFSLILTVGNQK